MFCVLRASECFAQRAKGYEWSEGMRVCGCSMRRDVSELRGNFSLNARAVKISCFPVAAYIKEKKFA